MIIDIYDYCCKLNILIALFDRSYNIVSTLAPKFPQLGSKTESRRSVSRPLNSILPDDRLRCFCMSNQMFACAIQWLLIDSTSQYQSVKDYINMKKREGKLNCLRKALF